MRTRYDSHEKQNAYRCIRIKTFTDDNDDDDDDDRANKKTKVIHHHCNRQICTYMHTDVIM
jgi:hypothetical protein